MDRSRKFRVSATGCLLLSVSLGSLGSLGCENLPTGGGEPTSSWNQQLITTLAGQLATQMTSLYTTAEKEPAFAGDRSAYGQTLDNLRILREEATGLHAKLEDGKSQAETLTSYERIKEVARDTREAESWTLLPPDFTAKADAAFAVVDQLDAFYAAP
jgi:hypothetical protein